MSDDLFEQLFELFNQPGPVNWRLAEEIARRVSGPAEPVDPWRAEEYLQLTRLAQLQIAESSRINVDTTLSGSPVDRHTWVERNLQSFRYLVEPLASKFAPPETLSSENPMEAILKPLGPALLGMQMGVMVGFLSHRVLGQFDVGLPSAEGGDLYLIVPNIEAFATDHDLDPRQVRLWVALHEVTHQAEFSVPWVKTHFIELINEYLDGIEFDPTSLTERLQQFQDPSAFEEMMSDPAGMTGFLTTPQQQPTLKAIQAFMAVMEGYADYLMDHSAENLLPDLGRMRVAMDQRRSEPAQGEDLLGRLLGLELKREQYELGSSFCGEIERRWGDEALDHLWQGPEHLPSLAELEDPVGWAARVLLDEI